MYADQVVCARARTLCAVYYLCRKGDTHQHTSGERVTAESRLHSQVIRCETQSESSSRGRTTENSFDEQRRLPLEVEPLTRD